jgi:hypothetical protein
METELWRRVFERGRERDRERNISGNGRVKERDIGGKRKYREGRERNYREGERKKGEIYGGRYI